MITGKRYTVNVPGHSTATITFRVTSADTDTVRVVSGNGKQSTYNVKKFRDALASGYLQEVP